MCGGAVRRFLRAQSTTATIDGDAMPDASTFWGPMQQLPDHGAYATTWWYDTGMTLTAGESVSVTFDVTFTRPLSDGGGHLFPPGSIYGGPSTCRITASP